METKWQEKSKQMVSQCEKKWQRKYDDVVEESETSKRKLTESEEKVCGSLFGARGFIVKVQYFNSFSSVWEPTFNPSVLKFSNS
jgi:hypothetical protein